MKQGISQSVIATKSPNKLMDQLKCFLDQCDPDTHTYIRVYSAKQLMRTLQSPYRWDIVGHIQQSILRMSYNEAIYGAQTSIDYHNIDIIKQVVQDELIDQVMKHS
jgi:hypothetical protein